MSYETDKIWKLFIPNGCIYIAHWPPLTPTEPQRLPLSPTDPLLSPIDPNSVPLNPNVAST